MTKLIITKEVKKNQFIEEMLLSYYSSEISLSSLSYTALDELGIKLGLTEDELEEIHEEGKQHSLAMLACERDKEELSGLTLRGEELVEKLEKDFTNFLLTFFN